MLDSFLKSEGDLDGDRWSRDLYWRDGTTIRHGGRRLGLTSKIRFEQWTMINLLFVELKTRLFSVSTDVEWVLYVEPSGLENLKLENLKLVAQVTNVRNVPPDVEKWLGLRVKEEIQIPLPSNCGSCDCATVIGSLDARLKQVEFHMGGDRTVSLIMALSASGNLTELLKCVGR